MRRSTWLLGMEALALVVISGLGAAQASEYERTKDVIYGRKAGLALTMDVFTPKKGANGIAVIAVASGGWVSGPDLIQPICHEEFLRRGYTVFAIVHGSQPTFTILDIIEDVARAVRFIRYNAKTYQIDPKRLGIMGASSGGHLAMMQGTAGNDGNPNAKDPVERVSSRVQAVGSFYAPTDFLNFGKEGNELINRALVPSFTAEVDYKEFDDKKAVYVPITDENKLRAISRKISPISHVDAKAAPTLLLHGTKDEIVPLQQSQAMLSKLREAGVPAELIEMEGIKHGDRVVSVKNLPRIADWFDTYLLKKPEKKPAGEDDAKVEEAIKTLGGNVLCIPGGPITYVEIGGRGGFYGKNNVSNGDLKNLAGLKSLKELDMRFTKVTDEGLKELAGLSNLENLILYGTDVTDGE